MRGLEPQAARPLLRPALLGMTPKIMTRAARLWTHPWHHVTLKPQIGTAPWTRKKSGGPKAAEGQELNCRPRGLGGDSRQFKDTTHIAAQGSHRPAEFYRSGAALFGRRRAAVTICRAKLRKRESAFPQQLGGRPRRGVAGHVLLRRHLQLPQVCSDDKSWLSRMSHGWSNSRDTSPNILLNRFGCMSRSSRLPEQLT